MLTISEIQSMPNGSKVGQFTATIKKPKSKLLINNEWTQECVLSDKTGEIAAEVFLVDNEYMHALGRGETIETLEAQLQSGVDGLRLYVFRYTQPTQSEPEPVYYSQAEIMEHNSPNWNEIAKGKVRCAITCAKIQAHDDIDKAEIIDLVEFVMKGK